MVQRSIVLDDLQATEVVHWPETC